MKLTSVSLFSKTVDRLVTGWFLTTILIVPSIGITTNNIDSIISTTQNFAESNNIPILASGLKKINKVLLFVEDADTKFSQEIDLQKWLKNPINTEKILGYLIFFALIWESPRAFYFYIVAPCKKLFDARLNKKSQVPLNINNFYKLSSNFIIWKANPHKETVNYSLAGIMKEDKV
ncbi:MAG: hypothetical protein H7196_05195 [candidate division SR1 bacterium]|nr:hypothetical protein [candidate division SR1 bacterium]